MPSIQIDVPTVISAAAKRDLAERIGEIYGRTMQVARDLLTVAVHDLGEGGVWRCHDDGPPSPSALIMCDIRGGRPVETRAELASALVGLCADTFGLDRDWIKVEFTQHRGAEMFHPHLGGFNQDWTGDERSG